MKNSIVSISGDINTLTRLYEDINKSLQTNSGLNNDYIKSFKDCGVESLKSLTTDEMDTIKYYTVSIVTFLNATYTSVDRKYCELCINNLSREFIISIKEILITLKYRLDIMYRDLIDNEENQKCLKK